MEQRDIELIPVLALELVGLESEHVLGDLGHPGDVVAHHVAWGIMIMVISLSSILLALGAVFQTTSYYTVQYSYVKYVNVFERISSTARKYS